MDRKFVVTGGYRSKSKVAEFTEVGTVKYLPRLKTGRYGHACSTFDNDNGDKVRVYYLYIISSLKANTMIQSRFYLLLEEGFLKGDFFPPLRSLLAQSGPTLPPYLP